ncbi:hypothetical protein [Acuticoccus sediminis]|jgi:hypothetical protein|uniref:hypothetical protein n=1 Tax=Acuticoccus sediminis TaxID=2184697 RepID=UPI001CFF4B2A|nr:hypothetical protein [Acuticoccus sediminis]
MAARIIEFPTSANIAPPIAQFVRIGEAHKKFGELVGMGRFPAQRVVFLASRLAYQKRLIELLKPTGVELVLDAQVAELASQQKFHGQERHAPWGVHCEHGPLGPAHFAAGAASDVIGQIARTAVEYGFHVVLAPTHFLNDPDFDGWLSVDRQACLMLRAALDREGGGHVHIDYPVLHSLTSLYRSEVRAELLSELSDLPFDNLWLRASGTEGDAGPESTKRFLSSLSGFHNSGKPLILDYLGGTLSQAAIAFGMASGKAHGIGEMERFAAQNWHKPPRPPKPDGEGFGRTERITVPGLGRSLTKKEAVLLTKAHGGKKLLGCHDRTCCPHGDDLFSEHRHHLVQQTLREIEEMQAIPLLRRDDWFLKKPMADMVRRSRSIADLKPPEAEAIELKVNAESLMKRLKEHARKTEKVQTALEVMHENRTEEAPRARPAALPRTMTDPRRQDRR